MEGFCHKKLWIFFVPLRPMIKPILYENLVNLGQKKFWSHHRPSGYKKDTEVSFTKMLFFASFLPVFPFSSAQPVHRKQI